MKRFFKILIDFYIWLIIQLFTVYFITKHKIKMIEQKIQEDFDNQNNELFDIDDKSKQPVDDEPKEKGEVQEEDVVDEPKPRRQSRQVERKMFGSTIYEVKKSTGKVIRANGQYIPPRLQLFENEFLQTLTKTNETVDSSNPNADEKIPFPTMKFLSTVGVKTVWNYAAAKKEKADLQIGYLEKFDSIQDEKRKNVALAIDEIACECAEIISEVAPYISPKSAKAIERADKLTAAIAVLVQTLNN